MIAVSFLCGVGLALAFPRASLAPLAWLAPVPWIALLARVAPRRGFLHGLAFGSGFFGLLLAWLHAVLTHYTSLPLLLTIPIWLLLVAYLAAHLALFGALVSGLGARIGRSALLFAPFLWVGLEFARGRFLGGFPWGSAGYAATGGLALQQAASVGGEALVSFLLVASWCALAVWFPHNGRPSRTEQIISAATLALVGGVVMLGTLRMRQHPVKGDAIVEVGNQARPLARPLSEKAGTNGDIQETQGHDRRSPPPGRELAIALIQGGFGGDLDYEEGKRALARYLELSRGAASSGPDLIVWPESNAPFLPESTKGYLETLQASARDFGCPLMLGGVGGAEAEGLTNSAYLIGPEGIRARYDKRRLVQYGEYVPLKTLFPFIRHFVPEAGEFRPGAAVGVMSVEGRDIGVSICYEIIFPEELLLQARAGSELLINLTNDSWYRWGGPWQHSEFAAMRAIETGLYVARAASTGRTMLIDPLGRTIAAGPVGGEAILKARIPLPPDGSPSGRTLFVRWGEWVGTVCATITTVVLAFLGVGNMIDRSAAAGMPKPSGKDSGP